MDRNNHVLNQYPDVDVALRKESVDRNIMSNSIIHKVLDVALRKESVDRNTSRSNACLRCWASLSARRAWIEIKKKPLRKKLFTVALRKESVDRNNAQVPKNDFSPVSLSARRAWIEII